MDAQRLAQNRPGEVAGPPHRNGAGRNCVFEHQRPAHGPGEQFAHRGIGVGVGGARYRDRRGDLGIAERRDHADHPCDSEGEHEARAGLLRTCSGEHENPRPDYAADAEQHQLYGTERTMERLLFGRLEDCLERLDPSQQHRRKTQADRAAGTYPTHRPQSPELASFVWRAIAIARHPQISLGRG